MNSCTCCMGSGTKMVYFGSELREVACPKCKPGEAELPFRVDVPAKTVNGKLIEIRVYTEPLTDGGYVINVKRPSDPLGKCWGTVVYPFGGDK